MAMVSSAGAEHAPLVSQLTQAERDQEVPRIKLNCASRLLLALLGNPVSIFGVGMLVAGGTAMALHDQSTGTRLLVAGAVLLAVGVVAGLCGGCP